MVAPMYGSWRIAFRRELVISSLSGNEILPGEIVTTFKPWPGALGGGCDGAAGSGWCEMTGCADGGASCVPASCELLGPVPDACPGPEGASPEGQFPLDPMLRTGRGGTLGLGLFWSVIDSLSASYVRIAPPLYA